MSRHIHIICPGVPWPPVDSKAIDTLEQLKLFHNNGVKIHLHYYCRDLHCHPNELNRFCESIHRYGCKESDIMNNECQSNKELLQSLAQDDFPVLFEGLHCTATLNQLAASGRNVFVRMHDDECRHAHHVAKEEAHFIKRIQLKRASGRIKKYEDSLPANVSYIFSNRENADLFTEDHALPAVTFVPVLYPFKEISSQPGSGNFCLYQGDLTDASNEKAVTWLLEKVFNDIKVNFVIAGKNPSRRVRKLGHLYAHTCMIVDPSPVEMEDLVSKAHIHVLPSFSYKRPELKLVYALHKGRHCIVNENAVVRTNLEPACYIANSAHAFKSAILELNHKPFEETEILLREKIFNNEGVDGEKKLMELIFN